MSKFKDKLTRSNKTIKKERAARIDKITSNQAETELMNVEQEIMEVEDELEAQLDLSTDNRTTTMNRLQDWDANEFLTERYRLKAKLRDLEEKKEIIEETNKDLFE